MFDDICSLAKPHAVEQLATDLGSYNIDVAIISETHFKSRQLDSVMNVPGYTMMRRDPIGKRCGGVALYVRESYNATMWDFPVDDRKFEVLWARVGDAFIGAVYRPPRSSAGFSPTVPTSNPTPILYLPGSSKNVHQFSFPQSRISSTFLSFLVGFILFSSNQPYLPFSRNLPWTKTSYLIIAQYLTSLSYPKSLNVSSNNSPGNSPGAVAPVHEGRIRL